MQNLLTDEYPILGKSPEDETDDHHIDDILGQINTHLTKEEKLCVSLYKNSSGHRNTIHKVFLKKYHGKLLSSAAISLRKKRMFKVLAHVGELIRYKKENHIDGLLEALLTKRQSQVLMLYERRRTYKEMKDILGVTDFALWSTYDRAIERLNATKNPKIARYLILLRNLLKFSRKFPKAKK